MNVADAGAVGGGNLKWTKEKCIKEAKIYKKRTKFAKGNESAYNSARNNNWLDEVCSHMELVDKKSKGYWTKEKCKEEFDKFETRGEFQKKSGSAYQSALKNGWINNWF